MKYYQCKCGKSQFFGSGMNPPKCQRCSICGSNIASGPNNHSEPLDHDFSFVEEVQTDEGIKTITRCVYCLKTKHEIESEKRS